MNSQATEDAGLVEQLAVVMAENAELRAQVEKLSGPVSPELASYVRTLQSFMPTTRGVPSFAIGRSGLRHAGAPLLLEAWGAGVMRHLLARYSDGHESFGMILAGPQGVGKSRFCKALGGKFYAEGSLDDYTTLLQEALVIEVPVDGYDYERMRKCMHELPDACAPVIFTTNDAGALLKRAAADSGPQFSVLPPILQLPYQAVDLVHVERERDRFWADCLFWI